MARGKKMCGKCKYETGPRSKYCDNCGAKFNFVARKYSPNKVIRKPFNWRELGVGDFIKSVSGHGPFYPSEDPDTQKIEIVPMGHHGIFKVCFVSPDGIGAYEVHKGRATGFCFLYMGEPKLSPKTDIVLRPHKIRRVIRKQKQ